MRKKLIILSIVLLVSISVAGSTFAWFYVGDNSVKAKDISTIEVETIGENRDVRVKNTGTGEAYVRVRLIPQAKDPSISVENLDLNIGEGWKKNEADGYYYYKGILGANDITSNVLNNISLKNTETEYSIDDFKVKVVSEGVQTNKEALERVWEISSIPGS